MIDADPYDDGPSEADLRDLDEMDETRRPVLTESDRERARDWHAAARRVHIVDAGRGPRARLDDVSTPHPRGLHVSCAGEFDESGGLLRRGCGALVGQGCRHPERGSILGFVHPSRMAAELLFIASRNPGIATATVAV